MRKSQKVKAPVTRCSVPTLQVDIKALEIYSMFMLGAENESCLCVSVLLHVMYSRSELKRSVLVCVRISDNREIRQDNNTEGVIRTIFKNKKQQANFLRRSSYRTKHVRSQFNVTQYA